MSSQQWAEPRRDRARSAGVGALSDDGEGEGHRRREVGCHRFQYLPAQATPLASESTPEARLRRHGSTRGSTRGSTPRHAASIHCHEVTKCDAARGGFVAQNEETLAGGREGVRKREREMEMAREREGGQST